MKLNSRANIVAVGIMLVLTACAAPPAAPAEAPPPQSSRPKEMACENFIGIDPSKFASQPYDVYWTLSFNFKAFDPSDDKVTYACLRVYGRPKSSTSSQFQLLNIVQRGTPVPVPCATFGPVSFGVNPQAGSELESLQATITTFGQGSYLACDFSVKDLIDGAVRNGDIMTTTVDVNPLMAYTYSNFAMGVAASAPKDGLKTVDFLRYSVEDDTNMHSKCLTNTQNEANGDYCKSTAFSLINSLKSPKEDPEKVTFQTILNGSQILTPNLRFAAEQPFKGTDDPCDPIQYTNTTGAEEPYIWWSQLGSVPKESNPQESITGLSHYVYKLDNQSLLLHCFEEGPFMLSFYMGPARLYIGGVPNGSAKWQGEIYEFVIDPPNQGPGTGKPPSG